MCQMDIVKERQAAIDNSGRITDETSELRKTSILPPTMYYIIELDQTTWCIGVAIDEIGETASMAREDALRSAAIFDMVEEGMMCDCGKHKLEYASIPRKDSFLTGYVGIVIE